MNLIKYQFADKDDNTIWYYSYDTNYKDKYPEPIKYCDNAFECPAINREEKIDDIIELTDIANDCEYSEEGCPILKFTTENEEEEFSFSFDDTIELNGVEVFSVGQHKGREFSSEDLQRIVDNFNATREEIKPPMKTGHRNTIANSSGMPALGWVTNVYTDGNKIKADFENVPAKIGDLIKAGAYRRVSIELLPEYTDTEGELYNDVLVGVALLGSELPQVKNLEDVDSVFSGDFAEDIENEKEVFTMEYNHNDEGGENVEFEEIVSAIEGLSEEEKLELAEACEFTSEEETEEESEEEVSEFSDEVQAELEKRDQKIRELERKHREQRINEFIDSAVQEGKLLDKQTDSVREILEVPTVDEFSEESEALIDKVEGFINSLQPQVDTDEYTSKEGGVDPAEEEGEMPADKAKELSEEIYNA